MIEQMSTLSAIYHYPVKGFNGISLDKTTLEPGSGIPDDRRFVVTRNLPADYDGSWLPPRNFTINSDVENLQKYQLSKREDGAFHLAAPNGRPLVVHPDQVQQGVDLPPEFTEALGVAGGLETCRMVEHHGGSSGTTGMWDYQDAKLSIINLATVSAISEPAEHQLDPLRFRGNLMLDGLAAWMEYDWIGKIIQIGGATLEILRPIDRCPATSVDPGSGDRDFDMPVHLQHLAGHVFCGVYARVVEAGELAVGCSVTPIGHTSTPLENAIDARAPAYPLWPRMAKIEHRNDLGNSTLLTVSVDSPWPLQPAASNQRARIQIPQMGWTGASIERSDSGRWMLEISRTTTDDPKTEHLRTRVKPGDRLIVSGPYGRQN